MITVNLFDSNFGEHPGSTAFQTPEEVPYVQREMHWDGISLFTDEWMNNEIVEQVQSRYKVGWLREPYCLHESTYIRQIHRLALFDFTLTYDKSLLEHNAQRYKFCPYGGSWIDRRDWGIRPKTKGASLLVGDKMSTNGHCIRRAAANAFGDRLDLYGSLGTPVGYGQDTKKQVLADYRFSVITETCYEDNLWTEWVGDALALGTVPVLWGCPNIDEFFDPDGFILWHDLCELDAILPTLTRAEYDSRWRAVQENQERMAEYRCMDDWIARRYFKGMLP
jgi:hypothetical protein